MNKALFKTKATFLASKPVFIKTEKMKIKYSTKIRNFLSK